MLSAQLGGIHFTDARACSGAIKMKWSLVERILEMSDSSGCDRYAEKCKVTSYHVD